MTSAGHNFLFGSPFLRIRALRPCPRAHLPSISRIHTHFPSMPYSPSFHVAVNVLLFRRGRLLLGERIGGFGRGFWGLPGGHLERFESMEQAARRELLEETGMRVPKLVFANIINEKSITPHFLHIGFYASSARGKPRLREPMKCHEWKWFELDSLPRNILQSHAKQIWAFRNHRSSLDL